MLLERKSIDKFFDKHDVVVVNFTKKNGEKRRMKCTKNMNLIPNEFHPTGAADSKKKNPDNYPVFDMEANGWRSFNISSLISISGEG